MRVGPPGAPVPALSWLVWLLGLAPCWLVPGVALGQPTASGVRVVSGAVAASAQDRAERALEEIDAVLGCMDARRVQVAQQLALLREARKQYEANHGDARLREDARQALEVLAARAQRLRDGLQRCLEEPTRGADEPDPAPVVYRDEALTVSERSVAIRNSATHVVLGKRALGEGMLLQEARWVDGDSSVPSADLERVLRSLAARWRGCLREADRRGRRPAGTLTFSVRVEPEGLGPVNLESGMVLGDAPLARCFAQVPPGLARSIRTRHGWVVYSGTLRLGSVDVPAGP